MGTPNVDIQNYANTPQLLVHDADMDAVAAFRATCQMSWSF
ncbi:MAG TPA: hypothetical protein PLX71_06875 [Phycicoccus sp.]|nr:hypothetical protein [Phycicoccus sp.]